jgi:hypothetical protein
MGWPDHPIFGQWVARATPYGRYGVASATPRPWGVVWPPQNAKKTKEKKEIMGLGFWGWLWPPLGPWGWSGQPQKLKPILFFFFFWPFKVAGPPPKGLGVADCVNRWKLGGSSEVSPLIYMH